MAGIYIHIPYCRQACHYCDFHFSTSVKTKPAFPEALKKEIILRKNYLGTNKIETIYFGGGTPSLLTADELSSIFEELQKHFTILPDAEITLEANPDDLNVQKLKELKSTPINRLSIGIQSFRDEDLKLMNRAHTKEEASDCVKHAQDAGFNNITIDLIYGIPGLDEKSWRNNLHAAVGLQVQHISSYCLTVEPRTALSKFIKDGRIPDISEEHGAEHFRILKEEMSWHDFIQYEISNFGKKGFFSCHNSSYWKGVHYLGLGPSAHSFNGNSRQWNISNNQQYILSLQENKLNHETETLTPAQRYNEYIMTSLRTMWGCDLNYVNENFGNKMQAYCSSEAEFYLHSGKLVQQENVLLLSDEGMLIADRIAGDLFFTDAENKTRS